MKIMRFISISLAGICGLMANPTASVNTEDKTVAKNYTREEWKATEIKRYNHWTVSVDSRQHTLGTLVLTANRDGVEKPSDLNVEELNEFIVVMKDLEMALESHPDFRADRFNYLQFGNALSQLHFHVVPRYKTPRQFDNKVWIDPDFTKRPELGENRPDQSTLIAIRDALQQQYKILGVG